MILYEILFIIIFCRENKENFESYKISCKTIERKKILKEIPPKVNRQLSHESLKKTEGDIEEIEEKLEKRRINLSDSNSHGFFY